MEQKIYYVAISISSEIFMPTVVEKFENRADADYYAALMCRTKHRKYSKYIVLEQVTEWDGTPQENA